MPITYPTDIDTGELWRLVTGHGRLDRALRDLNRADVSDDDPRRKAIAIATVDHLEACRALGVQIDGEPEL